MAETINYNLYKPEAGESGWAQALNTNLDIIDGQIKSNQDGNSNHTGTGSNKHNADQIRTANGSNVESEIAALISGKANTNHTHTLYAAQNDMDQVLNTLDILAPDLTNLTLFVNTSNRNGGIRITFVFNSNIYFTQALIQVEKNGVEIASVISTANLIYINESELTGVEEGDQLNIIVTVISGLSSKGKTVSHIYNHTNNNIIERLNVIETQLTIGNIIDSFAQDADALQALANVLHSSNTLAQKVAELSQI